MRPFESILVPFDGSLVAAGALRVAIGMAGGGRATLTLLCVLNEYAALGEMQMASPRCTPSTWSACAARRTGCWSKDCGPRRRRASARAPRLPEGQFVTFAQTVGFAPDRRSAS